MNAITRPSAAAIRYMHWLTLTGYSALFAGIYLWHLVIHKTPAQLISFMLIIQLGPLIFPLRGLLYGRIYTHAWSIYLAIFYFIIGVWYAGSSETWYFGLYLVGASLLFFAGTVFYTRLASRALKADQPG